MIPGTVVVIISHVFSILILRSLYFVSFFIVFKELCLSVRLDVDKQTGSFPVVFHHYVWPVCYYLFVSLDGMSQSIVAVWE